jgi:glutaredoxin 3
MFRLYVLPKCPYCNKALSILDKNKIKYEKIVIESHDDKMKYKKAHNMETFPQIFFKKKKIGGCDKLEELFNYLEMLKKKNISVDALCYLTK